MDMGLLLGLMMFAVVAVGEVFVALNHLRFTHDARTAVEEMVADVKARCDRVEAEFRGRMNNRIGW